LPKSFYKTIACSILIPIAKDSSAKPDVRPIALGDTLSKVIGKLMLKLAKDPIEKLFRPFQLGIGLSSGTEIIAHSVEAIRTQHPDCNWDTAQLDYKNAFNSVSRESALYQCLHKIPIIFPYLNAMYSQDSKLFIRDSNGNITTIDSKEGARQGDTLGPLFYCLGSLPMLNSIIDSLDNAKLFAYIDDITIIGPKEEIKRAVQIAKTEGSEFGLHLNLTKSTILKGSDNEDKEFYVDVIDNSRIKSENLSSLNDYGFICLGTPIGNDAYIKIWLSNKVDEIRKDSQLILSLPSLQCQWLLLYYVLKNKLTYVMRTIKPELFVNYVSEIEEIFKSVIQNILGDHATVTYDISVTSFKSRRMWIKCFFS